MSQVIELLGDDAASTGSQRASEFSWGLWAAKWSAILLSTAALLVSPYVIRYYWEQRR